MDSSLFGTCLITDPIISDITPELAYAVNMGAANKTAQQITATSASSSSVIFSVQVPSENIIVDRHVTAQSTMYFTIQIGSAATGAGVAAGDLAFNYGDTDSFQSFPFNRLITTAQASINNCSVSTNEQDVLDSLLRFNNSSELYRYNSTTPSLVDQAYGVNYQAAVQTNNNPMASYSTASYDVDQVPRGAFPVTYGTIVHHITAGGTDPSLVSTNVADWWTIQISISTVEPLLTLSPFTWCDPEYNSQGLVGINNITMNFTLDGSCKRVFSTASESPIYTISPGWGGGNLFGTGNQPTLNFQFLSSQPTQLIQSKNVVPFYDYPRYITTLSATAAINATTQFSSNTIQINQVPDMFILFVRTPMSQQNAQDPASFYPITNVSVNFNNASGLLSNFTQQQLWDLSIKNGINQSWAEWGGDSTQNSTGGQGVKVPTTGSILVINPAYDLSLPNYLSNGSLGNYQAQFQITIQNNTGVALAATQLELVIITANSGIFVTNQGQSTTFTGLLTKEMVLSTASGKEVPEMSRLSEQRLVGGKMLHRGLAKHMSHLSKMMTKKSSLSGAGSGSGSGSGSDPGYSGAARGLQSGHSGGSRLSKMCK